MTDTSETSEPQATQPGPELLLVFTLSNEKFGLSVNSVSEILDPLPITRVPNAPEFVPAVLNVRGSVVPLVDIRKRLRMRPARPEAESRMVVLELKINDVLTKVAIEADTVNEVIETEMADLELIPDLGATWPRVFLEGVVRHRDSLVVLFNTDTLFRPDDDGSVKKLAETAA